MARVKLQLPPTPVFSTMIPVRITDVNYGNHVGNDSLVAILHEARMQWLKSLGYTELDIEGIGVIMSDLVVEYKNESFYGDELRIQLFVGDISSVSFELYYHVHNSAGDEIAKAKTGMVCFNYDLKKVAPVPAAFLSKLSS